MARKSKSNSAVASSSRIYKTAIYARLSREGQKKEKIEAQVEEVRSFLNNRAEFDVIEVYEDDGYSGTNFKRPAFIRMMEDVRNRKLDCIIVKDLSRFAREHIGAEDYLNNIFPFLGIRFIAVLDGYDNINITPQEYFLASFKNLAHAHFAAETSRKVSMAKRSLQEQGKFIGSKPAFGYKRDPNDKHKLVIDENIAPLIREMYTRVVNGERIVSICQDINQRDGMEKEWTYSKVYAILRKEIYKGTLVQRKKMMSQYNGEASVTVPKEKQVIIDGAVPAIVSDEIWTAAQAAIKKQK